MPISRKRRAPEPDPASSGEEEEDEEEVVPPTARRRRPSTSPSAAAASDDNDDDNTETPSTQGDRIDKLARKLVRYALSCEHSRTPIRRADIVTKVLGKQGRVFKAVFQEAQLLLQGTFGMEMRELPGKEKVSVKARRAEAQKTEKQSTAGTQVWILTSSLPPKYRTPIVVQAQDSAYVGLYTFIIATILLAGGTLPEPKLERYLRRTNAETTTPVDKTDKLFQRLIREGYIVKIKDTSSGEEMVEYRVGPRGKVEVDKDGVASLVRSVFGSGVEDLEKKLERSLGIGEKVAGAGQVNENGQVAEGSGRRQMRGADEDENASGEEDD